MKVRAMLSRKAGFTATALPGHKANMFIEGTLVGSVVVVPPGQNTNQVEGLGFKAPPWLVIPFAGGKLEWVACGEDPTQALLGNPAPASPPKAKAASKEA
jgi:hypothetical protein